MVTIAVAAWIIILVSLGDQLVMRNYDLPQGAVVIETKPIPSTISPNRAMLLWVQKPEKHPRPSNEPYTCPEETRGSYYSALTRVSLVDTKTHRVINTIRISNEEDGYGTFDIPYKIHAGSYYHVPDAAAGKEAKPMIMRLQDFNGDGKALEFPFFDAQACMGLQTTLVGYSELRDQVIQYPIELTIESKEDRVTEIRHWIDYLFSKKSVGTGYWKYAIDYRGRGGTLDSYEIRYNTRRERFEGKLMMTEDE